MRFDNLQSVITRRVEQFSELWGFDKKRLQGWGFGQAVLAGWWSYQDDGDDWEVWIDLARILAELV